MKPRTGGRACGGLIVTPPADRTGLSADSIVLTLDGEKSLADIRPGDRVITRDTGIAVVQWITIARHLTRIIRIRAGSLGHTRPDRDVTLPAAQPILVRDWRAQAIFGAPQIIVPASRLVDGEFVTLHTAQEILLCSLGFDHPHVLYVDGLELASGPAAALTAAGV
ncbi:Hint domain-containing protein [Roseovarius azorensis]|uniref:Hint domain-containing protein n=1 Tax=Roseovarius azorensis TaxID=1287727 RepID=A0A1H7LRR9_9RHOB|nr:Hint domain-containing protein [Roseovarius azorensis]SEL01077.1 Hint domain-containing protein [Roseovarius azorensis]